MRKRVLLASFVILGCALLGLAAANIFPDQTWRALTQARTLYDGMVSRITPMASGEDRYIQECQIYESLVRGFVGSSQMNQTIFLRVAGADPSERLLGRLKGRLKGTGLVLRKESDADFGESFYDSRIWTDPATGGRVRMIAVGSVRWVFGDTVEVYGGEECGSLCGGGGIYRLVKRHGEWKVADYLSRWIS